MPRPKESGHYIYIYYFNLSVSFLRNSGYFTVTFGMSLQRVV